MAGSEIWAVVETRDGAPTRSSLQLIDGACALAAEKNLKAAAVLLGGAPVGADALLERASLVLHLDNRQLHPYEAGRALFALGWLCQNRESPVAILFPASAQGLELAPRLAARLRTGYLAGCIGAWWEGEQMAVRRAVLGGRAYQEAVFEKGPAVITIKAGAFSQAKPRTGRGELVSLAVEMPAAAGAEILGCERTAPAGQDITEAGRVVAGGRGASECFGLVEELAALLGGAVGASRAVVDAGLRPLDEQVGKSGKTVSPDLYIACGISGAVHHVLGMNTSRVVAAINSDAGAAIFKNADFGLVGDARQVLPALIEAVRSSKHG